MKIDRKAWLRGGVIVLSMVVSFGVLVTSIVNKKYDLAAGDIAPVDFKANVDLVDEMTTQALIADAVNNVQRQYKQNPEVRRAALKENSDFFNGIISSRNPLVSTSEIAGLLAAKGTYGITPEGYLALLSIDNSDLRYAMNIMNNSISKIYDTPLEEDDPLKLEQSKTQISDAVESINFSETAKEAMKSFAVALIKPNYSFDEAATLQLQEEARDSVTPVIIKKNQTIVTEGEPITANQLAILEELGYLNRSGFNVFPFLGLAGVVLSLHGLMVYYLRRFYRPIYDDLKRMTLIFLLISTTLLMTRVLVIISPFILPYTFLPMLLTILVKKRVGQTLAMFTAIMMAVITGFNVQVLILLMLTSVLSVIFLKKVEERNDIILSSISIGAVTMLLALGMGLLLSASVMDSLQNAVFAGVGVLTSGIMVIGVLPIIENTFNVVTEIKLLELANPNNPLLKRLQMEAPGTYHHSIMVGNLAEAAAEELHANSILLRVSAYYHDIGKLSRPQFFKENQIGSKNPHDEISPNLSTLIILNHVKIGLEMAEKAKLPEEIKDMIAQHHGTTLVKYFYLTMKNNTEDHSSIKEEDFRYPGPKPKSREAGIMMLADSVEAAVRSITEPTAGKVEAMVYKIFKDKLEDGQLDECDITFSEVAKIRLSFLKTLGSIYHERIEYPEDKRKKLLK
ncbi:HDIG domain-containing protein [Proteiniclasticum sp. BAD-10]|uniref:HDIG domain-containing protein n=1 Tax=Proteiniclasticum sediminis TaxID=2804028 RepID=A0A941CPZ9_9CLOT|nr:HDIG domain-containing metalloprotein [Proteiniclasticum sediminis]MBR0576630.1 HDIG domain-containing protein [Proteiniclasticum sediminis]